MTLSSMRAALKRRGYREFSPDELAALGRPMMIQRSLVAASAMYPDLMSEVERLAKSVTPYDDEARFWALKVVLSR